MPRPTILSHLATRPGANPEAFALASLALLLQTSPAVESAVFELLAIGAPGLDGLADGLTFRQGHPDADDATPPLLGLARDGATRVVIEGKFWAALPESRPARWVQDLPAAQPSAVLILAPSGRFTPLWAEIRRRWRPAHLRVHSDHSVGMPIRWARFGENRTVILASWDALLASARTRLRAANDQHMLAELDQLAALCERMESDALLPLTVDDLGGSTARKLAQLFRLVDELGHACEARGQGELVDGPPPARPGHYERRLRLGTTTLALCLSVDRWATLRETPFWLLVYDADGRPARGVDARLEPLAAEVPPRLLRDAETGGSVVPLFAPTGADGDTVVAELVGQVAEVARLLGEGPTSGFGSPA